MHVNSIFNNLVNWLKGILALGIYITCMLYDDDDVDKKRYLLLYCPRVKNLHMLMVFWDQPCFWITSTKHRRGTGRWRRWQEQWWRELTPTRTPGPGQALQWSWYLVRINFKYHIIHQHNTQTCTCIKWCNNVLIKIHFI